MNPDLIRFLEQYAELERNVQELVNEQCTDLCAACSICCCRADICEEALASPFLSKLHQKEDLFSDRYGFLTEIGCGLEIGRPPICYEFFCGDLLEAQPDDLHREAIRSLGLLPTYAGKNASGNIHLTEIRDENTLKNVDLRPMEKQMQFALEVLNSIQTFYREGALPEHSRKALHQITTCIKD